MPEHDHTGQTPRDHHQTKQDSAPAVENIGLADQFFSDRERQKHANGSVWGFSQRHTICT